MLQHLLKFRTSRKYKQKQITILGQPRRNKYVAWDKSEIVDSYVFLSTKTYVFTSKSQK